MRRATITILSLLALCPGCGGHGKTGTLSESSVVVAFGNSLTFGTGASKAESYPSVLSDMIQCRVVNAGVPGEVSSSGRTRLGTVLEKENADLVIICHGGNDMLHKRDEGAIKQNLGAMIASAQRAGADVILIGVPKPEQPLKAPPFYQELADKHGIPLDSDILPEILSTPSLRSDQVHPNAAGYKKMAQAIADLIRQNQ